MPPLLNRLWSRVRATVAPVPDISATLWLQTLQRYPFLATLSLHDQAKLRALSALFLHHKQFHGAHGLVVTDAMAIDIAAQACLPLLHWGDAAAALGWYGDFVGIVVHPGEAVARRQTVDEAGVVHEHTEVLLGEAMERGPIMLSWQHVANASSCSTRRQQRGDPRVRPQNGHAPHAPRRQPGRRAALATRLFGHAKPHRSARTLAQHDATRLRPLSRSGGTGRTIWWRAALAG